MQHSLRTELLNHVIETMEDQQNADNDELHYELHYYAFNEDYYIIYHSAAQSWIERHELNVFDMIADVIEWEQDNFGEVNLKPGDINPEKIVNSYVYILGEELLNEFDLEQSPEDLLIDLKEALTHK